MGRWAFVLAIWGLTGSPAVAQAPYIDTHSHLHGHVGRGEMDFDGAARIAVKAMDDLGIVTTLVMPPPFPPNHSGRYIAADMVDVLQRYPGRFGFLDGGGSLNPMLQEAADTVSEEQRARFRAEAERIAAKGAAGFGELTVEHLSMGPMHPYLGAAADHPLLLLLADIAAAHDMPIELHMEAIERDAPLAERYASPPNPPRLRPNIEAFERLLAHNRKARVVWCHLGWDNTGQRTPELTRRLLLAHPNLFLNVKMGPDSLPVNRPLQRGEGLQASWRQLIVDFPDRIMLGSDQFYVTPRSDRRFPMHMRPVRDLLDQLPEDVARQVGLETPRRVYRLNR